MKLYWSLCIASCTSHIALCWRSGNGFTARRCGPAVSTLKTRTRWGKLYTLYDSVFSLFHLDFFCNDQGQLNIFFPRTEICASESLRHHENTTFIDATTLAASSRAQWLSLLCYENIVQVIMSDMLWTCFQVKSERVSVRKKHVLKCLWKYLSYLFLFL